ncbi:hypothetical protein EB093_08405 [bacterium]|nr:hypothetical protein [bacterium]
MGVSTGSYKLVGIESDLFFVAFSTTFFLLGGALFYGGFFNKTWFIYPEKTAGLDVLLQQNIVIRKWLGENGVRAYGILVGGAMISMPIYLLFKLQ